MAGYLGNTPIENYSTAARQTFSSPTGTGFTLSKSVSSSNDIALFVNNVRQDPTTYTATGTTCLLYTSPSPRDKRQSRMPSSA